MLFKFISLKVFLIGFFLGIFMVYIMGEDLKEVYIYPTLDNIAEIQYKDKADNCFVYKSNETQCPADISLISSIPIQS
jgi:hypothetical protein